ncbi:NPHP4 (predicted) [Pycnogonum litorale]
MNEDRLNREHLSPDGSELTVSERRLQIGVHNGWSYIQEPQIHHLVSDAVVSSNNVSRNTLLPSGHVRSSSTTSRFSDSSSLMLRNKVELRDVPENCFIVFLLEYVLSFPITMLDRRPSSTASVSRGSTMSVAVCWCRWLPDDKREESEISLTLVGGPAHNLDSLLLYRNTLINDGDSMKLNFEFSVSSSPKKIRRESTIGHAYLSDNESLPDTVDSKPLPSSIMKSQNVASREPASCPSIVSSAEMAPTVVQRRYETEDDDLIDRTSHPNDIYLPIIPALPGKPSLSQPQLTRIGYSQLYSIGFPNIVDRHGKPPHIVEFRSDRRFETKKELRDSLKCNEIVIELLAMSGSGQISSTQSVLFAFQFYRFPSTSTGRLHLGSSSSKSHDSSSHPYILYKTNKNGTKKNPDDPGFQIKYDVNNDFLYDDKEHETFVNYLQSQFLLIDVWDAESLFFVGTAAVPLKFLCRQGREAVQCLACDLDVRKNRYLNATDISQTRDVECRLHVRLANVGRPLDLDALKKKSLRKKTGCAEVIRPMIEKDRQLSKLLESFSRNVRETASSEKTRKLARMEALRSAKGIPNNPSVNGTGECNARDKLKDLKIIADYRDKYKDEVIRGVLCRSICTDYVLYPVLGNSYVIVHPVVNDTAQPTNVIVESLKSSLRVVTDYKEWLHLKELFDLNVNVEENTFIADDDAATANGQIKFYLRSKETILVPFVYQRIKFTHVTSASVLEVPTTVVTPTDRIKVSFVTNPDGKILSMTNINVRSQPINCDQHYTFYHAESSSFKTYVEIPKNLTGRFSVRASDADVICSVEKGRKPHQQHVFVKASCSGGADSSMTFYLFLYSERYCHRAVYSWKITVHLLEKVDVRCVAGQTCRTSLVLRGEQITRQVRAYSSNVNEMAVEPSRPFILPAGAVQEIRVGIRVLDAGSRYMQVNVVDDETPKLIKSWMICVQSEHQSVTKSFQVDLPMGGAKSAKKRVKYTNPYAVRKSFTIQTNRPDLIHFKEHEFELNPGDSYSLGLYFLPRHERIAADILVFINNGQDENEETFSIRVSFS